MTAAEYYSLQCKDAKASAMYRQAMPQGKLKYPTLPTINIGSAAKPVLVPPEFILIPTGQCRAGKCTGDMTASLIRVRNIY